MTLPIDSNNIYSFDRIFVEVWAGSNIDNTIKDCIRLAEITDTKICFMVNGKFLEVDKDSIVKDIAAKYWKTIDSKA